MIDSFRERFDLWIILECRQTPIEDRVRFRKILNRRFLSELFLTPRANNEHAYTSPAFLIMASRIARFLSIRFGSLIKTRLTVFTGTSFIS